jgi:hypothetical protein
VKNKAIALLVLAAILASCEKPKAIAEPPLADQRARTVWIGPSLCDEANPISQCERARDGDSAKPPNQPPIEVCRCMGEAEFRRSTAAGDGARDFLAPSDTPCAHDAVKERLLQQQSKRISPQR